MKKISLLFGCFILNSFLSFGQVDVSLGMTMYNSPNSFIGLSAGASFKNLHFDISSNLKGGNGSLLD